VYFAKTRDLNGCPLLRMPTNLLGRRFNSTLRVAYRQLSAQKGLFNCPHISFDMKYFVSLHAVHYICVAYPSVRL